LNCEDHFWEALCRILEAKGWKLQRIQGSHYIYTHPGSFKILTLPVHGNQDLKKGTLARLAKDADLSENDF
jgi:predicted RNA binding protein YcfA (HicA-like mRNA interferase family)